MNRRVLLHIGFWLVYAMYDGYLSAPLTGSSFASLSFGGRLLLGYEAELFLLAFKIPAVYFVLYWVLPRYIRHNRFFMLGAVMFATAAAVTLINQSMWYHVIYPYLFKVSGPPPSPIFAVRLFRWGWSSFDIVMLLGITSALKLFRYRLQTAEREKQLIEEKLQSELQFLRAQTNPHFLFNTLNNIYGLARKPAPLAAEVVLRLSKLLRFMLYECARSRIPIGDEIKVIRDYIELEKLRYNERLTVTFEESVDDPGQLIAPLLLLPFVENAFKHGAGETRFNTHIDLLLTLRQEQLHFEIKNNKDPDEGGIKEGIGLKNVRRQLELTYPEKHTLAIENQSTYFKVTLEIRLDEPYAKGYPTANDYRLSQPIAEEEG